MGKRSNHQTSSEISDKMGIFKRQVAKILAISFQKSWILDNSHNLHEKMTILKTYRVATQMILFHGFLAIFQKRAFQHLLFLSGNHENDSFAVRSSTVHCISVKNDNFKTQLACFSKEMLPRQN